MESAWQNSLKCHYLIISKNFLNLKHLLETLPLGALPLETLLLGVPISDQLHQSQFQIRKKNQSWEHL